MKNRMRRRRSSVSVPKRKLRRGRKFDEPSALEAALRTVAGAIPRPPKIESVRPVPPMRDPIGTLGHPARGRRRR